MHSNCITWLAEWQMTQLVRLQRLSNTLPQDSVLSELHSVLVTVHLVMLNVFV